MAHKVTHDSDLSAAQALRAPPVRDLFADAAGAFPCRPSLMPIKTPLTSAP